MPRTQTHRTIQVQPHTLELFRELTNDLREKTGEHLSISSVVQRAGVCLKDAYDGERWLTGEESGTVMEERHRKAILNTLGVVVPIVTKGAMKVTGMSFDDGRGLAFLHMEGGDMLQLGYRALADVVEEPVGQVAAAWGETVPT